VSSADQPSVGASVIDVLDHVLDKGIVIDAWMSVSLVGIDLLTVEARVLVASIETYLQQAEAVSQIGPLAAGQAGSMDPSLRMLQVDGNPGMPPKTAGSSRVSPKMSRPPGRHRA